VVLDDGSVPIFLMPPTFFPAVSVLEPSRAAAAGLLRPALALSPMFPDVLLSLEYPDGVGAGVMFVVSPR